MKAILRGFATVDYVKKESDVRVQGLSLYLTCPDANVIGENVKNEFISAGSPIYNVFKPYLSGEKDMDELIGARLFIDYDVTKHAGYTKTSIVGLDIMPAEEK